MSEKQSGTPFVSCGINVHGAVWLLDLLPGPQASPAAGGKGHGCVLWSRNYRVSLCWVLPTNAESQARPRPTESESAFFQYKQEVRVYVLV